MLASSPQVSQQGHCEDSSVEEGLVGLLEASSVDGAGWSVKVDVEEADGPVFVAKIEIEDPEGGLAVRSVSSPSCVVTIDAVAFIVATALAEERLPEESPPPLEPEPESEPELALEPEPEPMVPEPVSDPSPEEARGEMPMPAPVVIPPREPASVSGRVFAGAGIMRGALPGVVGEFRLGGAVEGELWRAELGLAATSRHDARAAENDSVGADLGHWAVDGRGCGVFRPAGTLSVPLCAGAEVGQLYASGFGFSGARTITLPWGAAIASLGLGFDITPRLRLAAQATAGLVLNRAEIIVDNLGTLHVLSTAFGRGWLGLEVRI